MSIATDPARDTPPQRCHAHVEECTACSWRTGNDPERPCVKCGGVVIRRPCKQWPMHGSSVCVKHGGRAPQVRKAGKRRLAAQRATKLADATYEPVTDPMATLADIAGRAVALMGVLEARVEAISDDWRYTADDAGTEQLRSEVSLLERAMDRAGKFAAELTRLGFDERRVAIEEAQAELVVAALRLAVERVGLLPTQRQDVIDAWSVAVVELEKANEPVGAPNPKKG